MNDVVQWVEFRIIRPDGTVLVTEVIHENMPQWQLPLRPRIRPDGCIPTSYPEDAIHPPWISQVRTPGHDWVETDRRDHEWRPVMPNDTPE